MPKSYSLAAEGKNEIENYFNYRLDSLGHCFYFFNLVADMNVPKESTVKNKEIAAKIISDFGNKINDTSWILIGNRIQKTLAAVSKETFERTKERCQEIAKEGPWLLPVFEDETTQEVFDKSCDAFGNQIAVLIKDLPFKEVEK